MIKMQFNEYSRIQKRTAEKMYNNGINIYLIPCNANPDSPWIEFISINNETMKSFQTSVNSFEYYNCNSELGKYASFYIKAVGRC